ncbi:MAG: MgtC/SapB family protein [Candidatus Gracilibacteria bacterium]
MDLQVLLHFFTAAALAGLIGTEREIVQRGYEKDHIPRKLYGGVRTHILLALFGAIIGFLTMEFNFPALIIGGISILALFIFAYYVYGLYVEKHAGITSELSGLLTFLLGVLCLTNHAGLAVIVGIGTTIILSSKSYLSNIFNNIERKELYNTLKFAVILFVILPILPNQALDPWNVINLYDIWKVVVLISGISYVGYILSKTIGSSQGIILMGALGGIASSTATTSSMAEQSKKNTHVIFPFVIATIVASTMMFLRVVFWVASFNIDLLPTILLPIGAMMLTSILIIGGFVLYNKKYMDSHKVLAKEPTLVSPFQILPALKFALFFLFVSFISEVAVRYFSENGTYIVSFLSGLADMDPVAVKASQQALNGTISSSVAAKAIVLAMITNTFTKMMIAKIFGGKVFGNAILIAFFFILGVGAATLFFI